jgi:hypothetical protein
MQLKKTIHIGTLIWNRYKFPYILSGVCTLLFIPVLGQEWAELQISLDVRLPLFNPNLPPAHIKLSGWETMGYFSALPFIPFVLIFIPRFRKHLRIIGVTLLPVYIIYGLTVNKLIIRIDELSLDFISPETKINLPFYFFLCLIALNTVFNFQISKK